MTCRTVNKITSAQLNFIKWRLILFAEICICMWQYVRFTERFLRKQYQHTHKKDWQWANKDISKTTATTTKFKTDRFDAIEFAQHVNILHNFQFAILFSITTLSNGKHNNLQWKIVYQLYIMSILNIFLACHKLFSTNLCCDAENIRRKSWLSRMFNIWSVSMLNFRFSCNRVRVQLLHSSRENEKR